MRNFAVLRIAVLRLRRIENRRFKTSLFQESLFRESLLCVSLNKGKNHCSCKKTKETVQLLAASKEVWYLFDDETLRDSMKE
uniref:Uncharacterized protein n=1 Tax=Romanomermis culicivorax TaxID=13658 RepID=A0A915K0Z4_ROMCU